MNIAGYATSLVDLTLTPLRLLQLTYTKDYFSCYNSTCLRYSYAIFKAD